jgi:hypothetical protein
MLCVGAFLAAYRTGLDRGYLDGRSKWRQEQYLPRAYFAGDIAGPEGKYLTDDVKDVITRIDPTTWESAGGLGAIDVLFDRDRNPVFVITTHQGAHDAIASILADLRADEK